MAPYHFLHLDQQRIRAFKILFKNAEGKPTLSSIKQGPGLTPAKALEYQTQFVKDNYIDTYECQPQH